MIALVERTTGKFDGYGSQGEHGVGNSEANSMNVTRKGRGGGGPSRSQGEGGAVGTMYSATLDERPNISNPRNRGPARAGHDLGKIPTVTMASRNTGKISG